MSLDNARKKIRDQIEKNIEKSKSDFRNQLATQRMQAAHDAMVAMKKNNAAEATKALFSYISFLEATVGVPPGGLSPGLFDSKKDAIELLTVCGVYWDLARILDKSRDEKLQKNFNQALQKFVLFTKGQAYQSLASETLRKYLRRGRVSHRKEFKEAYKVITGMNADYCFIATALFLEIEPNDQQKLRKYRDKVLLKSRAGKMLVKTYYFVSPPFARLLENSPETVRRASAGMLKGIMRILIKE